MMRRCLVLLTLAPAPPCEVLARWLHHPMRDRRVPQERHAAIASLLTEDKPFEAPRRVLREIADIERITAIWQECIARYGGPFLFGEFGAVGDGVTDDLPAIVEAHAFANAHSLSVKTKPDATYHLGRRALTAVIATDTDWGTSRFIIDDTDVENHRHSLFSVQSLLEPLTLAIPRLTRDQRHLDVRPPRDCWVRVENSNRKRYIREGLNQNNGTPQRDCFILRRDGTIEGAIDGDYATISKVEAHPIDERPLVLKGGIFTTTANRMKAEKGYNYWSRNIAICVNPRPSASNMAGARRIAR